MSINITKVKLLSGDKVEVDLIRTLDKPGAKAAAVSESHKEQAHPDFVAAFASLDVHAALLGEFVPVVNIPDIFQPDKAIIDKFHVSGITIVKPDSDDEGVIITAGKTLNTGKYLGFNTPTSRFNDVSDGKYPYLNELQEAVKKVLKEAELYLGGKYNVDPQGTLDLKDSADGGGEDDDK